MKTVPGEPGGRWIPDPIGLEPFEDVVMAGDSDEALLAASDGLGDSSGAYLRYLAIYDGGELIHDVKILVFG